VSRTDVRISSIRAKILVCICCLAFCLPAFSLDRDRSINQFYYTFWSEKEGAPSQITALAQTEDGYLWIGSERGLFHFDGVRFEEYKPQGGVKLPSYSIFALMPTPDGGLWIALSPNGLGFLKNGSLTVFTRKDELPDSPVHCFARDHEGRVWAGTEAGLVLREGNRWIDIGQSWNLPREMIRYLFVDREGTLWVATIKRIAFLRQGSTRFELGGGVGTGVTTLAQAKDGRVWLADDGRGEIRPVPLRGHNTDSELPSIVEKGLGELLYDRDGALWITDLYSGIIRIRYPEKLGDRTYGLHDPELELFGEKDGFSGGIAGELLEDREGNIWVGCSNGLVQFRHTDVLPVRLPEGYEKMTLLAGEHGGLWVGTIRDKPLLHIRGENIVRESAGEEVASVLRASNRDIWWGSRTGVWRQRGKELKYFLLPKQAVPDWMWDIIPSRSDDGLWIKLGDVGFVHFNQGTWNLHDWPAGVPSVGGTFRYGPSASYQDAAGRLWLGYTSGHVIVVDRTGATVYSQTDGLDVGHIEVIRGRGQHIWVGGDLGLIVFSKRRFWRVRVAGGEPFGAISGIVETLDGGLWLNEMRGIAHIPPEEIRQFIAHPNHRVKYRRFDYLDGLPGAPQMQFTSSTAVETSDGRLWFATDNGLARIDPAHFVKNIVPPPVSILSIGSEEEGRQTRLEAVKFAPGTQRVEIEYTALSLSIPERVQFRYRLEGVDADWQNVGTRRQAYYSNLGPGDYRFRVIACNNDGVWNDAGALLNFSILPAYYQTTWFRMSCLAAFLTLLGGVYLFRLQQLVRDFNMRLEERVGERTRIARDLHDTLLQTLHGLMFRFQAARNMLPRRPEEAMEALDAAITRTERAIAESRDAIKDLRSEGTSQTDLAELLTTTSKELETSADANCKPPAFRVIVEGGRQALSPGVQDEIYRIGRELVRNAFRHARADHVEAEIRYDDHALRLLVRDDGKGMDPQVLKQGGRSGHWGLPGVRERAKQIGAQLDFWSEARAGTEVQLSVPAAVAYKASTAGRRFRLFRRQKLS
jgi:signal transduction histidine kinase/ligand-binding sensor domain-containing protein